MFKHILVPTDGSELSLTAAHKGIAFAADLRAKLTFLFVLPERPLTFFGGEGTLIDQMDPDQLSAQAGGHANHLLSALVRLAYESEVEADKLIAGPAAPYEAIIAAAEARDCDLIMMASHGYRGLKALLLGSETQRVLTYSKIPVLVYR